MTTLADFILQRVAEDEAVAREAVEVERPGLTWHWVTNETDMPVEPGDEAEALENQSISLRTVASFPVNWSPTVTLPAFLISSVDEGVPGALRHIARHDPARVLAQCEAVRRIVENCRIDYEDHLASGDDTGDLATETLGFLALPYADHPDYDEAWRP